MVTLNPCIDIPVLALRDVVIFPRIIVPLYVGRAKSIHAVDVAIEKYQKRVLLLTQKEASVEDPSQAELFRFGTLGKVLHFLKLADGTVKVLIEGEQRASVESCSQEADCWIAHVQPIEEPQEEETVERKALRTLALGDFENYVRTSSQVPPEIMQALTKTAHCGQLADIIAIHLPLSVAEKQQMLETLDGAKRLQAVVTYLKKSIEILSVRQRIHSNVEKRIRKDQRKYYLTQEMREIQKEIGEDEEGEDDDIRQLAKKLKAAQLPKEANEKAQAELRKLRDTHAMSPESSIIRSYLECLIHIPWVKRSKIKQDLGEAERILEQDHFGLEKVKERILEYLAVQQRVDKMKGPILCLVGAPGVGKTSLAQSIARATGRKFTKMSLGGMRDEAEIRGHRRTYLGSLPGKIIQNLIKVKVKNPLFLLDEIDKISEDFRGDPASALLEVLDPEQNHMFNDHYLEVDCDLSDIMFVATANTLDIEPPLLDRMETIMLSGYTEDEKMNIASRYLLPKQFKASGLKRSELKITESAILDIIRYYTREAGVRSLERELSKICRKVVRQLLTKPSTGRISVGPSQLEEYLGVQKYRFGSASPENQVGQVTGLAWTEVGGELLTIEAATMSGKGESIITGQLGEVMEESVRAAISVIRSRAERLGIRPEFFEKHDIHVHLPEGAVPKDGPSAGAAICTALVSILTRIPVRADFAMTGEITLRGEVLPIGGLKEKLLAARRGGIKHVIIPIENQKDLKEIGPNVLTGLEIHQVRWIEEVFKLVLVQATAPLDLVNMGRNFANKGSSSSEDSTPGGIITH